MKHLFTLLVGLCLIPFITNGQTLLDENFATGTGSTPPTGWTQTTIAGDPTFDTWRFNNPASRVLNAPISNPAAIFDSDNYSNTGGAEDVVLTSPVFSGVGVTTIVLTFDHYFQAGFGGAWAVEVFDGVNWVSVISGGASSTANPQSETVDISAQAAGVANAQVRLHWTGNFSWFWIVDNVKVVAPVLNNVGVASVNQPGDGCGLSATESVSITIENFGLATQTSIPVAFSVNGGAPVMETYTGSIAAGGTDTYTFTGTANLSTPGVYSITAYTMLASDTDFVNDTASANAEHFVPIGLPVSENFDAYGNGVTVFPNFSNDPTGTVAWRVNSGTTPSSPTGPSGDKNGSGKYIYIESSGAPLAGWKGKLVSDCIDLSSAIAPNLIFSYHMFGADIDSLEVEILSGSTTTKLLSILGPQQLATPDPYITDTLDLAAFIGSVISVRFTATVNGFLGDVALDEISVKDIVPIDLSTTAIQLPADGCGLSDSSDVTIVVKNEGTTAIAGFAAAFAVDGGPIITPEIVTTLLNPGDTYTYTFIAKADLSAIGPHVVGAGATTVGDQVAANDTAFGVVTNIPTVSTLPYFENFENGNGFWTARGTNSSWAFGTPAKAVIIGAASGSNAWTTGGLTGEYPIDENSEIVSPCFDMSSAPANSAVALKVWWETEFSWDGAVLQSTNDDGTTWTNIGAFGDPNNWYTDNTINSLPGGQQSGWSGRVNSSNGSNGWRQAQHALDSAVIGQPNVRFRIAFGSDASGNDDGFAFDDFAIGVPPQVQLGPDSLTVCIGSTLSTGVVADVYAWSTGDTTPFITIANSSGVDTIQKIWVSVVDSLGFSGSDTILLNVPAGVPGVTATLDNNVNCNGDSTGQASAIATGGQGIILYEWNTTPAQTTAVATGLPAGSYTVTVVDENGCEATSSVTVSEPSVLDGTTDSTANALCAGDANGAIAVTVFGGTAPYSYSWSNGATTDDITGLAAGSYTLTVTDSLGCTFVSPAFTIDQPDSISVALDALTDVACPDDTDGSISISVAGGTAPYSFLWDNGATTEDLSGLGVGSYTGTITDANGCVLVSPVLTITNTDSLPATAFDYGTVGAAVNFSNTTPNGVSYAWDFGDGNTSTDENPTNLYATNDQFVVSLTVTNDCGSTTVTDTILITQVGIEDNLLAANVSVYPNPTQGVFDIRFDELSLEDVEIILSTVEGKQVVKEKIGTVRGIFTHRMDLSDNLARGSYVLQIVTNQGVIHKRIQLQ